MFTDGSAHVCYANYPDCVRLDDKSDNAKLSEKAIIWVVSLLGPDLKKESQYIKL